MKQTIHLDTYQVIADAAKLDSLQVKDGEVDFTSEISGVDASLIERVKYKAAAAGANNRKDFTVATPVKGTEYAVVMHIKRGLGEEIERLTASFIAANTTANDVAQGLVDALNALQGSPVSAVRSTAEVQVTMATATGESPGEADFVEFKVINKTDNTEMTAWTVTDHIARTVPYGTYLIVQRLDDSQKVDFKGTAESGATYDEVTFFLKGEGTDRKRITFFVKKSITHEAFTVQKLRSVGVAVGAAGDTFRLALTSEASGGSTRTGAIYVGGTVFYVDTNASANNFIRLPEEFPHGSEVVIFNNSGSNVLKIERSGSETINNATSEDVPVNSMAILKKIADDEWGSVIS